MKVLSIGMDRRLFDEKSAVFSLHQQYAMKVEEMHIIVFSLKKHKLKQKKIGNLYLYPSNSWSRVSFLFTAYNLGSKIISQNSFIKGNAVITTQDPMTIVAYALAVHFKLPFQMQIHTDIFASGFMNSLAGWKNFWYSGWVQVLLDKFLIPRADSIRVVSEPVKKSLEERFKRLKGSIHVLPIFVDIENIINFEPKRSLEKEFPQFKFIIFMASRLTKEKRIDLALKALKEVLGEFPQTGLVIAGTGGEENRLKNLAKRLGLSKNVVFIGWQNDLVSLYKTADLFLLTSKYEGYGMTLVEAGASGCPIVTTSVGLAKTEMFKNGENCFVCSVDDEKCIAESILSLIHDNTKRELFKRRMRDSIKSMVVSRDQYTIQYVGLLKKLLKND